jgi:hypothetical protein
MNAKTQIAQAVSNNYKPRSKITNKVKSEVLVFAWRIRRDAAKQWNCKVTDVLMCECLKTAHNLKDFNTKEDEQKAHTENLISLVNSGLKNKTFESKDLAIIVMMFYLGKVMPPAKEKLDISQFRGMILTIPNGQNLIKNRTKPIIESDAATIKRFIKFAGDERYEVRTYLNYVVKNDKYFIACNGHRYVMKPRRTITPEGLTYFRENGEPAPANIVNEMQQKGIDQMVINLSETPTTQTVYNLNVDNLIAYLKGIKSLEKLINIKDIRVPIQIEEETRCFNLNYLLDALISCRLELLFIVKTMS